MMHYTDACIAGTEGGHQHGSIEEIKQQCCEYAALLVAVSNCEWIRKYTNVNNYGIHPTAK